MVIRSIVLSLFFCFLPGCSWLVPDHDKDYLTASELPPLKLPSDLANAPVADAVPAPETPEKESLEPEPDHQSMPPVSEGGMIQLNQPFAKAWVMTLKALNRLKLEVFNRNRKQGIFRFIHSFMEHELAKDRGWWEDLMYFFTGEGKLREREYMLRLIPADGVTRLYLLDDKGNPLSDSASLQLLNHIRDKLTELSTETE